MKMMKFTAALFAVLLLAGCAGEIETYTTESAQPLSAVNVSPLAKENFLEPESDFSWSRRFPPEKIMIHFSSAVVPQPENPYDPDAVREIFIRSGISVHYLIDRDGGIQCWVPENRVAWHAGAGEFGGDPRYTDAMNQYAIGIEVMAIGSEQDMAQYLTPAEYAALSPGWIGFTEAQYTALAALVRDICERHTIPLDRSHVIGHDEYSSSKNDPGELFDWERIVPPLPQ